MHNTHDSLFRNFYTIERVGAAGLSDAGGPFGFDINVALQIDHVLSAACCDAFIEAGTFLGDTTTFLARNYPNLSVLACDIKKAYADVTRRRVLDCSNAEVHHMDSRELIRLALQRFKRPFFYLDAHWYDDWPLREELALIDRGFICIDDFNIGHPRFAFDHYEGQECGPGMLSDFQQKFPVYYVNSVNADYPYPCLQTGRRAGKCYLGVGDGHQVFARSPYFELRYTPERTTD